MNQNKSDESKNNTKIVNQKITVTNDSLQPNSSNSVITHRMDTSVYQGCLIVILFPGKPA